MSLFIFPVPSAASPLPHPARQPCWVSHSLSDLIVFTCIISLASLECLSSSKCQVHCYLLREVLGALLALSHISIPTLASGLEASAPVSWLRRTLKATAGLKPQSAHLCGSNTNMAPDTESMFSERIAETEQINKMNVCDTKLCVKSFAHMLRGKLQWNGKVKCIDTQRKRT